MVKFKTWLENLQSQKAEQIKRIWGDTLKVLVGSIDVDDAVATPLSRIVHKGQSGDSMNQFKGKTAAAKKIASADIFNQLKQIDPELASGVEDAQRWLTQKDGPMGANADTTVGALLQKMFGKYFQGLLDGRVEVGEDSARLSKAPKVPPQENSPMDLNPSPSMPQNTGMQPQMGVQAPAI